MGCTVKLFAFHISLNTIPCRQTHATNNLLFLHFSCLDLASLDARQWYARTKRARRMQHASHKETSACHCVFNFVQYERAAEANTIIAEKKKLYLLHLIAFYLQPVEEGHACISSPRSIGLTYLSDRSRPLLVCDLR